MLRPQNLQTTLICSSIFVLPLLVGVARPAQALSLFTGYDANSNSGTVLPLSSRTNSTAAFNDYKANLGGVGVTTESFETTAVGTAIDGLTQQLSGVEATYSYTKKSDGSSAGSSSTVAVQKANAAGLTNAGTFSDRWSTRHLD
ncbi:MAG: hypothetical protein HC805_04525 [Alkalinema sp. RL_2_19]|nr:hypothetical protein [Alkalinema sp. RL_2_19]